MNSDDLLQRAQQITAGKRMSFGELVMFKFSSKNMVFSKEEQRPFVEEVKCAFSSENTNLKINASEVLVPALCRQTWLRRLPGGFSLH